jgi:hypothetical protein
MPTLVYSATKPLNYFLCRNGTAIRTIRSIPGEKGEECKAVYTKQGQDHIVASGQNPVYCKSVAEKIRNNLSETRWWKCRDISKAQLHESSSQ